eukprot:symbB.v1.2.016491.t1/scaffold1254.1/size128712/5
MSLTGKSISEVHFWQPREAVEDYMRKWVQEHKVTTRMDDLQPGEWFREKWQKWRDDLQRWHVMHIEFKESPVVTGVPSCGLLLLRGSLQRLELGDVDAFFAFQASGNS